MKSSTAVSLTKGALGLVKGCESLEVKLLEAYESDNFNGTKRAIQIGAKDGEMWIYKGTIEIEVPSSKLVGGAMDKRQVEGYILEALVVEHNYPHEPDWADVVVQFECTSFLGILTRMVQSLFGQMVANFNMGADHEIESEEAPWPEDINPINEF